MTLSQFSQRCPSFSLVLETADGGYLALNDFQPAASRQVMFERRPPRRSSEANFNAGDDRFMRTVDARLEGNMAYQVVYASEFILDDDDDDAIQGGCPAPSYRQANEGSQTAASSSQGPPPFKSKSSLWSMFRLIPRAVRKGL